MAIGQVSEEEFSYQLLFKPSVSPLPEPDTAVTTSSPVIAL